MDRNTAQGTAAPLYRFGTYCLIPGQRRLLCGTEPVRVGARAFTLLVALVERAGEIISPQELLRIGWPGVVVEEANLRVQVGTLRKLLEDRATQLRAIETVPLRGYCFVMPVEQIAREAREQPGLGIGPPEPSACVELTTVGRAETIELLAQAIGRQRLITITGPGGIGKTTVALAVARKCGPCYKDGVRVADFSPIADPRLIPEVVASALGVAVPSEDPVPHLIAHLRDKQLVLVFDTCEHLIDPITLLVEALLANLPEIRILATSRETLRAHGEWVHRLQPLAMPPDTPLLRTADVISYPAVELFLQRATLSTGGFELRDDDASVVTRICRQLDGSPLAIELAAAHVDEIGIREVAARLDEKLSILTRGRRTALPRHQTLRATMEWSYDLLSAQERYVLQHLCVFHGPFTPEAACAVVSSNVEKCQVRAALSNLHAKSLLTADIGNDVVLYRLSHTTRCFAVEKAMSTGNWQATQCEHAQFVLEAMQCAEREWEALDAAAWKARYSHFIEDVRGVLGWACSAAGNPELGVRLTAASAPLWSVLSLPEEISA